MRVRLLIRTLVVVALAAAFSAPAAQAATPGQKLAFQIYNDYLPDGKIDPCKYTSEQLKLAQQAIPPDVRQYASDLPGAIQAAIEARARGECADGSATPVSPATAGTATPTATPTPKPTPTTVPTKTVVPDPPAPSGAAGLPPPTSASDVALERAATARPANGAPVPLILLGVVAGLFALTALALLVMKRLGLAEGRLAPVRHSWREASWRLGGTWEDFRDWLRVGR